MISLSVIHIGRFGKSAHHDNLSNRLATNLQAMSNEDYRLNQLFPSKDSPRKRGQWFYYISNVKIHSWINQMRAEEKTHEINIQRRFTDCHSNRISSFFIWISAEFARQRMLRPFCDHTSVHPVSGIPNARPLLCIHTSIEWNWISVRHAT